jgi:hypothetical protein
MNIQKVVQKKQKACTSPSKISRVKVMQAYNHSATKAFPSSLYPNHNSANQRQKSFGSVINFIVSIKNFNQRTAFKNNKQQ